MERVLVSVYVPQDVAVLASKSEFGELPFAPTDDDLASITQAERVYLLRRFVNGTATLHLDCATPNWQCIVQALRREMRGDKKYQRSLAEHSRNMEAEDAAKAAAVQQAREAVSNWAMMLGGEYADGIRRGFDMEQRLVDWVQERVVFALRRRTGQALPGAGIPAHAIQTYRPHTLAWSKVKLSEQRAPNKQALDVLARVQAVCEHIPGVPGFVSLDPRIMRCEVDAEDGFRTRFTGVVIRVSCPCWKDSTIIVNTEN